MAEVVVVWDNVALGVFTRESLKVQGGLARLAARATVAMKKATPVSPVMPTYARPVPLGASKGPVYSGRGLARPSGPDVPRARYQGDLPLRPSGYLRRSIMAARLPDGSYIIGPTAPYAKYVNFDTRPHLIRSKGPWPLRSRATGQVFGPLVHHPGTKGAHFVEKAVESISGQRIFID